MEQSNGHIPDLNRVQNLLRGPVVDELFSSNFRTDETFPNTYYYIDISLENI